MIVNECGVVSSTTEVVVDEGGIKSYTTPVTTNK